MDRTIHPGRLSGTITIPASKSFAHRAFLCAALADAPTAIYCTGIGWDVQATIRCLETLGARIEAKKDHFLVSPLLDPPRCVTLPCRESGSTLRFLLPIIGALGVDATFLLEGRLSRRPLSPLWEEMERMGCQLSRPTDSSIRCTGQLKSGTFTIDGSVSSQFITGLMLALPLLPGSQLEITGEIKSKPYMDITTEILDIFGVLKHKKFCSPGSCTAEGDWSSAAFFLAANALGSHISLEGLKQDSRQGDRAVTQLLPMLEENCTIPATHIPDLIPVLSVVASCKKGAVFSDISRLRTKESDRVAAICDLLTTLGGRAEATENHLTVYPTALIGGAVDPHRDHRIAMAAAIAATVSSAPVTILGAECTNKSYPQFWAHFAQLGGKL